MTAKPLYQVEFPDFDPATLPAIPASFEDVSWHNDSCPSFLNEAAGLIIFVDFADPAAREFEECPRFGLASWDNGAGDSIVASDDFADILAAVAAHPAADLPKVERESYGVHYMRGGYMVVWADAHGTADPVDMGEGSGPHVGLFPADPYPVFTTEAEARNVVERLNA
jgi:hypothetical protein